VTTACIARDRELETGAEQQLDARIRCIEGEDCAARGKVEEPVRGMLYVAAKAATYNARGKSPVQRRQPGTHHWKCCVLL
jgi:hypothetical protein